MPRTVISGFPPRREGEACFLCISSDDKGDAREAAAPEGSSGPVEDLREANRRGRDRISQNCDIVEPGL